METQIGKKGVSKIDLCEEIPVRVTFSTGFLFQYKLKQKQKLLFYMIIFMPQLSFSDFS